MLLKQSFMSSHTQPVQKPLHMRHESDASSQNISEIEFGRVISRSKYPIFLATTIEEFEKLYAIKAFPFIDNKPDPYFFWEIKFAELEHPNLVTIVDTCGFHQLSDGENTQNLSYFLMELAPYGDFADLLLSGRFPDDDKLIRTYFQQLVDVVEYLHENGVAHLDIKPDNLLIAENYELKLTDFDSSMFLECEPNAYVGTLNYRAPELIEGTCKDLEAADVYSLAMTLFVFKAGSYPYIEGLITNGYDLQNMMVDSDPLFWKAHPHPQKNQASYSKELKDLIFGMSRRDPKERMTIDEVKESEWFNGPVYMRQELIQIMSRLKKKTIC